MTNITMHRISILLALFISVTVTLSSAQDSADETEQDYIDLSDFLVVQEETLSGTTTAEEEERSGLADDQGATEDQTIMDSDAHGEETVEREEIMEADSNGDEHEGERSAHAARRLGLRRHRQRGADPEDLEKNRIVVASDCNKGIKPVFECY